MLPAKDDGGGTIQLIDDWHKFSAERFKVNSGWPTFLAITCKNIVKIHFKQKIQPLTFEQYFRIHHLSYNHL